MMFQAQVTRLLRAFGGAVAARPDPAIEADGFDDEIDEAAAPEDGMVVARDSAYRANYPLGVTG